MGFDGVMKSLGGKLMEALLPVGNWGAEALAWFDGVFPLDTRGEKIKNCFHVGQPYLIGMGFDEVMKSVGEKLKKALPAVGNWGAEALAWFVGVFPPRSGEMIKHWFHVAQPYLIAGGALTIFVYLCCCCCGRWGGGMVKMMKAPGRNRRMPRRDFEINPRGYFQRLRSHHGRGKIKHWFHVAEPYLIAAVVLTMVVYFCRGGGRLKMMKAPGRNLRMPRHDFEIDPEGYFRELQSHPW